MKTKKIIFYLLTLLLIFPSKSEPTAITYKLNGGRLGDNLINYIKTKWLSYKYNIPIYYPKFFYSNQLMISKIEKQYNKKIDSQFNKKIIMCHGRTTMKDSKYGFKNHKESTFKKIEIHKNLLYISNYYANVNIDWDDTYFLNQLKKIIAPVTPIKKPKIPQNTISVALHIRKGGGIDNPLLSKIFKKDYADKSHPLKFPPNSYYIKQIKKLYEILGKKPLYVRIFTDDKNPKKIADTYRKALNIDSITFDYREQNNAHNKNVIQDLFEITHYDCFIRSLSNFATIADIIGNFKVVILPEGSYHWEKDTLIIDKATIKINEKI